jgi:hypothetical protein
MIIDTHIHTCSFPSYRDLSKHIRTTEDLIAFRTRYPDLYQRSLTEEPVDNSDHLVADMDKHGVALGLVQARPGYVSNDLVAEGAARHPGRLLALARVGHDQEAAGYHKDPGATRDELVQEVERCLTKLGMVGIGEIFIRSLTREIHYELIADDLDGLIREVALDRANGLTGKTVIHPSHVAAVHALSVVTHEEFQDATDVLGTSAGGGVASSAYRNKMNESKPHTAWAHRTMLRARAFGVAREDVSFVDLLGASLQQ